MGNIFNNKKTTIKNKSKYIVLAALMLVSIFSASYAVFNIQLKGEKKYSLTIGTLDFSIDNEENSIRLMNAYPMSDTEGQALRPYTFTLTNTGTLKEYYKVSLITDAESQATCSGCTFLSPSMLRYSLTVDGGTPVIGTVTDQTVLEIGELTKGQSKSYELRLWLNSEATIEEENKYYYGKIKVDASQEEYKETVTFAGITKEINKTYDTMFNYTSEGVDSKGGDSVAPTNGIYALEDDDAISYFYRGEVDNLVKFGIYTSDYYVYRYEDDWGTYDFSSLEACKYYNSNCSESNKVLKYAASDNVPMYWRIIRINGDGTIRMIYAGTTPDAKKYDTGIGLSRYNEEYDESKYTGYTYNNSTTEINSAAKTEIDTWYTNVLEGTIYDSKVAIGKFCSDSSGYREVTDIWDSTYNVFGTAIRLHPSRYKLEDNSSPTFKCVTNTESYGGGYELKAGLITVDEIIAAGGQSEFNKSYYLHTGTKGKNDGAWFWSMSPNRFFYNTAIVNNVTVSGDVNGVGVNDFYGMLRPVINLRADVVFKAGTDGSTTTPYEIVE